MLSSDNCKIISRRVFIDIFRWGLIRGEAYTRGGAAYKIIVNIKRELLKDLVILVGISL